MANEINSSDNTIDSRQIIDRIGELEGMVEALESDMVDHHSELEEKKEEIESIKQEISELDNQDDDYDDDLADKESQRETLENELEEIQDLIDEAETEIEDINEELEPLKEFASEGEGYGDWFNGVTLINDDYFVTYAEQLAVDIGAINSDQGWPCAHIDWDSAADALKQDYTMLTFDGNDFWIRS